MLIKWLVYITIVIAVAYFFAWGVYPSWIIWYQAVSNTIKGLTAALMITGSIIGLIFGLVSNRLFTIIQASLSGCFFALFMGIIITLLANLVPAINLFNSVIIGISWFLSFYLFHFTFLWLDVLTKETKKHRQQLSTNPGGG